MRILIDDGMQIRQGTGIGKYSENLYQSLSENDGLQVEKGIYEPSYGSSSYERLKYMLYINSRSYRNLIKKFNIVHYTNYAMPFFKVKRIKYVVTIHDLVSYIYPKTLPSSYRLYSRFIIRHSFKYADKIITVSNSVKDEMKQIFPQYAEKVEVIYPGINKEIENKCIDIGYHNVLLEKISNTSYFLFVGTIEERKNIKIVIDAFITLKETTHEANDYKLLLAGKPGYGFDKILEQINSSPCKEDIIITGYLVDTDCKCLYMSAKAFVFPSIYEGFGSPQIECMYMSIPTILSDIKTNREISKGYGIYFDLKDVNSLTKAMASILEGKYDYTLHESLAKSYLQNFSWKKIACEYLKLYIDILEDGNGK